MNTKKCPKCKLVLTVDLFYVRHKTGKLYSRCKTCELNLCKKYFKTSNGKQASKRAMLKIKENKPELMMLWNAKSSAKKMNREFAIDISDVVIPESCPVLGIPLFWTLGKRTHNTPSLDRIDSTRGYVKDNVIVISWRANKLKQDASLEELGKIWKFFNVNS